MMIDTEIPPQARPSGEMPTPGDAGSKLPENWKEALSCLVSSRIAIMQAESKDAAAVGSKKAALGAVAALCALFTWILLLGGAVGSIAAATSWAWYHVAFAAAGLHLLVAVIAIMLAKSKSAPSFPITRAEFEKDRQWLALLNKKPK